MNNSIKSKIQTAIDHHTRFAKSYFWSPPRMPLPVAAKKNPIPSKSNLNTMVTSTLTHLVCPVLAAASNSGAAEQKKEFAMNLERRKCTTCKGSGEEDHVYCKGTGKKPDGSECNCANGKTVCTDCDGTGFVLVEK